MELKHFNFKDLRDCKLVYASTDRLVSYQRAWLLENASRETDEVFVYEKKEDYFKYIESALSTLNKAFNLELEKIMPCLNLYSRPCNFLLDYEVKYIEDVLNKNFTFFAIDFKKNYEIFI